MNDDNLPAPVLAKLLTLNQTIEHLRVDEAGIPPEIENIRDRLSGRIQDWRDDPAQLEADMRRLLADQNSVKARLHQAQTVLSSCRAWLDSLPSGTKLELVTPSIDGKDLHEVRAQIKDARDELSNLKRAPTPSRDLRQRAEGYVDGLGTPTLRGIGEGERLRVFWKGPRQTGGGLVEYSCDTLAMLALICRERLVDAIMDEAVRMANEAIPLADRPARIATLEREIEELSRIEEALIEAAIARGERVHRSGSAVPQAVLGVKIAERVARVA